MGIYIKKLLKEMTECRVIQVNKRLKKIQPKKVYYASSYSVKYKHTNSKILSIYIKITDKCNLNCEFCSQDCNNKKQLSFEQVKDILDKAKAYGILSVVYTGGEPLLATGMEKMLKYGKSLGFRQTLVTNGIVLQNNLNILKYLDNIGISFHGTRKSYEAITLVKGSFDLLLESLQSIKNKIKITLNYTLSTQNSNLNDIRFAVDYAKINGFNLSFARINYIGKSKFTSAQDINSLCAMIETVNKEIGTNFAFSNCVADCVVDDKFGYMCHGCGAGVYFLSIDNLGQVAICPSSKNYFGSIFNHSFRYFEKKLHKIEKNRLKNLPEACKICKHLIKCRGGCKIECEQEFSCDTLVNNRFLQFKTEFLNKKAMLVPNKVILKGGKIVLPSVYRVTHRKYLPFLKMLDGNKTGKEIVKNFKDNYQILKLAYLLYQDKHLLLGD